MGQIDQLIDWGIFFFKRELGTRKIEQKSLRTLDFASQLN